MNTKRKIRIEEESLSDNLLSLLGEDAFLRLVEAHGGCRLHVPQSPERSELVKIIGADGLKKMVELYGRDRIIVPVARTFRARKYRQIGLSNPQIARKLVMSITGVQRLFQRVEAETGQRASIERPPRAPASAVNERR